VPTNSNKNTTAVLQMILACSEEVNRLEAAWRMDVLRSRLISSQVPEILEAGKFDNSGVGNLGQVTLQSNAELRK